jgi:hypothetical protein
MLQTTFFGHNCKIFAAFAVNSFTNFYFPAERPFGLLRYQRVITLPFPKNGKELRKFDEKFSPVWRFRDKANNSSNPVGPGGVIESDAT